MPLKLNKEPFNGKYDGVTNPLLLPEGVVAAGRNMRRAGPGGGWKPRKGCDIYNNGANSYLSANSFFAYEHPLNGDYHFIVNTDTNLYDCTTPPPGNTAKDFGTDMGVNTGTGKGFVATVADHWFFANGNSRPVTYGGDNPYCIGFLVWDNSASAYIDYTTEVTDGSDDTVATLGNAASDVYFVCMSEPGHGIVLALDVTNNNSVTLDVEAWRSGAWASVSGLTDGTSTTETHDTDGTISWTASASDTMRVLGGIQGYWYRVSFSGAIDAVTVTSCKVQWDAALMTNKWDGVYRKVSGCLYFDTSDYRDTLGQVTNPSVSQCITLSSATTAAYLYIKTSEPAHGFGFGIVPTKANTEDAQIDMVEVWTGNSWEAAYESGTTGVAGFVDETLDDGGDSSFSQSGTVWFDATIISPQRRTWQGDSIPGYWYRISWDATLLATSAIYLLVYAPYPEALDAFDGCEEFNGQLVLWGSTTYPNRLRKSVFNQPSSLRSDIESYTDPVGDNNKILCAKKIYDKLIVWKKNSVWLLDGEFRATQLSSTVGLASPQTATVSEVGVGGFRRDEKVHVAIWQDIDGVYESDAKTLRKISYEVDNYFNSEYTAWIGASDLRNRTAFIDQINNEYHLLLSSLELVFDISHQAWYPPFERSQALTYGNTIVCNDDRKATYGIGNSSRIYVLESGTDDVDGGDSDTTITHYVRSRAVSPGSEGVLALDFILRKVWAALAARATGSITTKLYMDQKTAAVTLDTPSAMSLVNSGYNLAYPYVGGSNTRGGCFQVEFYCSTADVEMEIYSFLYQYEYTGDLSG